MKSFLLSLVLSATSLAAQSSHATLKIRLQDNQAFTVVLNGYEFGPAATAHRINNIQPGSNYVEVYINQLSWGNQLVRTRIAAEYLNLPTNSETSVVVNFHGRLITESVSYHQSPGYLNQYYAPNQCAPAPGYSNVVYTSPGFYHEPVMGMDPGAFQMLRHSVGNQWFESGKETIIKQALLANRLSCSQVSELMNMLSFESTKLEVAKFSFKKVADPQNFFILNDCFSFSSSITELNRFIGQG
jgi:hypothetical protein